MRSPAVRLLLFIVFISVNCLLAQEQSILVPKPVDGAPFKYTDSDDLFGQAYRWFIEGDYSRSVDNLKKVIESSGFKLQGDTYYMVVANFMDSFSPIGLIYNDEDFLSTRMYGLKADNLYYIYISRQREGKSFLSVLATAKDSPFAQNLPLFIGLFQPGIFTQQAEPAGGEATYVDVRRFEIPEAFRKFSNLSVLVKTRLEDEKILSKVIFDNTSLEKWSFGVATAITNQRDVDIIVNPDGKITVRPKPNLDLAAFAVINYHFKAVDTKAPSLASSFHLLAGLRLIDFFEPLIGIGAGLPVNLIDLHLFAGLSMEFANQLKSGYSIGQQVNKEVDPFKTRIRPKFRFGLEVKFP